MALLLALLGALALASPAGAASKPYAVVVAPGEVAGGGQFTFDVTFTNLTRTQQLGSADLTVPTEFTLVSASPSGIAAVSGDTVQLRNLALQPGDSLTIHVVAIVPCEAKTFTWSVIAKQDNEFNGPPGNDLGPLVDSNLTTKVTCGGAVKLHFVDQPADARVNEPITTTRYNSPAGGPVTVEVVDAAGNPVTTSTAAITLSLAPDSGTLNGTTVVNAIDGVATFDDVSIDTRGTYTLLATSDGLTSATSDPFHIDEQATVCAEDVTVTCTATSPNDINAVFDITAQANSQIDSGVLTLNRDFGQDAINCEGYNELSKGPGGVPVDFDAEFLPDVAQRAKVARIVIDKQTMNTLPENGAAHLEMCFGASFDFAVKPGTSVQHQQGLNVGLLPDCGLVILSPCVSQRNKTRAGQGVIEAKVPIKEGDPRYSG